jgi:cytochrome d ubiquinol oxidase subunit II
MIGWAVGQYPYLLLPYLTIEEAAGSRATLVAMTVVLVLGSLVLAPALVYMYVLFARPESGPDAGHADGTGPRLREAGGGVTAG